MRALIVGLGMLLTLTGMALAAKVMLWGNNGQAFNAPAVSSAPSIVQVLGSVIGTADTVTAGNANLLTMSNNFDAPDWVIGPGGTVTQQTKNVAYSTLTAGQSDPSSGTTAYAMGEVSGGAVVHDMWQTVVKTTSAVQYTFSLYAKQSTRTRIAVLLSDYAQEASIYMYAVYNLNGCTSGVAATAVGSGWTSVSSSIASSTNGYCRIQLTGTSNSINAVTVTFAPDQGTGTGALNWSYNGSATSAILIYGAQLEAASSASTYAPTTSQGQVLANVVNGSWGPSSTTWWEAPTSSAWAGIDAGSGNSPTWTGYAFAPRPDSAVYDNSQKLDFENMMPGALVQTSSDPTFVSPAGVTQDTIPSAPFYPRWQLNPRSLLSPSSRAIRMQMPTGAYGSIGQLAFYALKSSIGTATAQPISPTISPWGGGYLSGSQTVTLASLTTSAAIYYTTDGSTPTNTNGTLYSAPFSLSFTTGTTLKAVAYDVSLSTPLSPVVSATFSESIFTPNMTFVDNRGILVEAHDGGNITYIGGVYYWIGVLYNKYVPGGRSAANNNYLVPRVASGVQMYSSTDLRNWTYVGNILPFPPYYLGASNAPGSYLGRADMLYCAGNNTYVIWAQFAPNNFSSWNLAAVASASSPSGPWTWQTTTLNPDGVGFKSPELFADTDGNNYVVYTNGSQTGLVVSQLTASNCLTTNGNNVALTGPREAAVLFKYPYSSGGTYFIITSQSNPANSYSVTTSLAYVSSTASNPLSGWGALPGSNLFASIPIAGNGYNGQSSAVLVPNGKTTPVLLMDWWAQTIYQSGYTWSPLTISGTVTAQATIPASWNLGSIN